MSTLFYDLISRFKYESPSSALLNLSLDSASLPKVYQHYEFLSKVAESIEISFASPNFILITARFDPHFWKSYGHVNYFFQLKSYTSLLLGLKMSEQRVFWHTWYSCSS